MMWSCWIQVLESNSETVERPARLQTGSPVRTDRGEKPSTQTSVGTSAGEQEQARFCWFCRFWICGKVMTLIISKVKNSDFFLQPVFSFRVK